MQRYNKIQQDVKPICPAKLIVVSLLSTELFPGSKFIWS
jgi:hypothetical protein